MKVYRAGIEFELTSQEMYQAFVEWQHNIVCTVIKSRIKDLYNDWDCSLGGSSLDEVVDEGANAFLDRTENGCIFGRIYDEVIEDLEKTYANENTIS